MALGASALPLASCSRAPEPGRGEPPELPAALIEQLGARIPALLTAARVPGLSIALVRDARIVWSRGFGVANTTTHAPVDDHTLFEAGSISKTVFAYAVMKLCETGLLSLDKPLVTYIADRWITDDPRFDRITARHVLSHTSGLPNWRSRDEPLRIQFEPGARWLYSGEGYSYLQLVVAHRTGRVSTEGCETLDSDIPVCPTGIDRYLERTLLRPFGMPASAYVWQAGSKQVAAGYGADGAPTGRRGATPVMAARYGAAGGLLTTAREYARFLVEVLEARPPDAFRLSRSSRDEMLRPHVKVSDESSWALGWQVLHHPKGDLSSHGGDNPGFKAFTLASVSRRAGYVILTNGDNGFDAIGPLTTGATPLNLFVTG